LAHSYLGTEHFLLGLIREGDSVAARVLTHQGATVEGVRQQIRALMAGEWQHG
jgi:ATP-dependent Clp protease ATP-binding subunit ClpC